jgi:WhiB family redox-sensing transcriptional regulator
MSTPQWHEDAACAGIVADLGFDPFYPEITGHNYSTAKLICGSCPVIDDCLAYALRNEAHGIWGGLTEEERRKKRQELRIELVKRRPLASCGTTAGYKNHSRHDERPCVDCRVAARRAKAAR